MSEFSLKTKVFFDKDANAGIFDSLKSLDLRRIAFIVDENLKNLDIFNNLVLDYKKERFDIVTLQEFRASGEPTYDELDIFFERFRDIKLDALIAVGGGTVLDIAKGVCILIKNPGKAIEFRGKDKVRNPSLPLVCYPTTAGTGSEVTHTASLIDSGSKIKLGINGKNVSALFAVLIPELTFSCSAKVTISSGLDAMVHAIEAVTAKNSNQVTIMLGNHAFSLLYNNFKNVILEPCNYPARQAMLLGSYYAGVAMMHAGGGPASGLSYPLGVHFDVPHGLAGGIFLRHIFEYNVSKGYLGYSDTYKYLAGADLSLNDKEKSLDFVAKFKRFYNEIGAPERLNDYGLDKTSVEFLTNLTMEQREANLKLNPISFGKEETIAILHKII